MKTNRIANNLNEYIINGRRKADELLEICLMNTDKFVSSPEFLPLFWHANYSQRTYIFSNLDFQNIENDEHNKMLISEMSGIMSDVYIKPKVGKLHDSYYVSCCYWTNFGGLISRTLKRY